MDANRALVIFSGGQDSTTCLGRALTKFSHVQCITFDYGQNHSIEIEAARRVIKYFEDNCGKAIPHEIVTIGDIFAGTSPLTNKAETLDTYSDHDSMSKIVGNRVEKTFVPMRNAVFLMLAANHAVAANCGNLVTGVCQADNANYPDCRQIFIAATTDAISYALGLDLNNGYFSVHTPLMNLSKAESIKLALETPYTYAALAYSHTAYDGQYPPVGKDHASILRAHGFEQADVPDPLVLRAWVENRMDLPEASNYRSDKIEWASDYLDFL